VWLVVALVLAVVGVVVFLFTEDMGLSMGWVDRWTIVNAIIFVVEIVVVLFVFHNKKVDASNTDKNYAQTNTNATFVV
jgi:Ca2+/Na+ antiporter